MEDAVCSGRLEKVPAGQGIGLCEAAAEGTGKIWVQEQRLLTGRLSMG